ncbi:MAG: transcriptional regulator [Pseudomarimonas sp.]
MATHTWDYGRAKKRIDKEIESMNGAEVVEYTRTMSLNSIPKTKAYRMDAVHLYADIINLDDILDNTESEGPICHKRTLRFLNQHYRAVHRILEECDAIRVDFHNQRLHAVVAAPYNSETNGEAKRVRKAVAIAQLIIDVLDETGDDDENIPNAKVAVGIDTGTALAVNNGRRGGREPLFLGPPANHAAKHSVSRTPGIYLTNDARATIGLKSVGDSVNTAMTTSEIKDCQDKATLGVTKEQIVKAWRADLDNSPIGAFEFSGHSPPMKTLPIKDLTPKNSRRQEVLSIYADIDGFTSYIADRINDSAGDVVKTLQVLRSELDAALYADFEGRRIRFIGDCIHGVICEGTAQNTDAEASVSDATRAAGALRSSFELAIERLKAYDVDCGELGLAIGFEFGQTAISRLGMKGDRVRCCVSRSVLRSEEEQKRCDGEQTAIGPKAYNRATKAVKETFGSDRRVGNLDYADATERLAEKGDKKAADARAEAFKTSPPAIVAGIDHSVRPHCGG